VILYREEQAQFIRCLSLTDTQVVEFYDQLRNSVQTAVCIQLPPPCYFIPDRVPGIPNQSQTASQCHIMPILMLW
jgi:hypothetical protein